MLTKDNTWKVLKLFFRYPEKEFHVRELARQTKLSAPGILKIVATLEKEGLLSSQRTKVVTNIKATRNEKFLLFKRIDNLFSLFESELVGYLRQKYEEPDAIVAFGSFARGEDTSTSDVDIAVTTSKSIELDLSKFEKKMGRKINIYPFLTEKCEKEFLNNVANGTVVHGYLRVLR